MKTDAYLNAIFAGIERALAKKDNPILRDFAEVVHSHQQALGEIERLKAALDGYADIDTRLGAALREAETMKARAERAEGRLAKAHSFWVEPGEVGPQIAVELRQQRDGSILWSVTERGCCLNRSGEWEYEPLPSSRYDQFTARCRFATLDEAWDAAERAAKETKP